jgi:hypothetical protein
MHIREGGGMITRLIEILELGLKRLRGDGQVSAIHIGVGWELGDVMVHQDRHLCPVRQRYRRGPRWRRSSLARLFSGRTIRRFSWYDHVWDLPATIRWCDEDDPQGSHHQEHTARHSCQRCPR